MWLAGLLPVLTDSLLTIPLSIPILHGEQINIMIYSNSIYHLSSNLIHPARMKCIAIVK